MKANRFIGIGTVAGFVLVLLAAYAAWNVERFGTALLGLFSMKDRVSTRSELAGDTIVMRTPGGLLEVARIKAYERVTRENERKIADGRISLGTTRSEISAAVLFRYHIEMAQEWPIRCDPARCVVHAGQLRPTLPPAIYTDETHKRTESGWARFDKHENLEQLERSLTDELVARAGTPRNLQAATEAGRRTVEEFVRTWMVSNQLPPGQPAPRIVVLFPGESLDAGPGAQ